MFINVASLACCEAVSRLAAARCLGWLVECGRPCQPAVSVGAMYSSVPVCLVTLTSHDQTGPIEL